MSSSVTGVIVIEPLQNEKLSQNEQIVDLGALVNVVQTGHDDDLHFEHHSDISWEEIRPAITRSYLTKNNPLHEVMRDMLSRYNFRANEKQYKYRIKKWKLAKYSKAMPQTQRSMPISSVNDASSEGVDNALNLSTPATRTQAGSPPLFRCANLPDEHQNNAFLFCQLRHFIPSSSITESAQYEVGTSDLYHCVRRVYTSLLDETKAYTVVDRLLANFEQEVDVAAQSPSVLLLMDLINICGWRHWTTNPRRAAVLNTMVTTVSTTTKHYLGQTHPFTTLIPTYRRPGIWQQQLWDCLKQLLEAHPSIPRHALAFTVHQVAHFQFQNQAFDAGERTIESFVQTAPEVRPHWPRKLHLLLAQECYEPRRQYRAAKRAYEYAAMEDASGMDEVSIRALRGLMGLHVKPDAFPDVDRSVELAWMVYEASSKVFGPFDDATLWDRKDLQKLLEKYGRVDECEKLESVYNEQVRKAREELVR